MDLRRVLTPHDLGAAVKDARASAGLTQAQLAKRAGVSREWLVGLERGARPRAEFAKIVAVLGALGMQLSVSASVPASAAPGAEEERETDAPKHADGRAECARKMSTAEVTRRAIAGSRVPVASTGLYEKVMESAIRNSGLDKAVSAAMPDLSHLMPDVSHLMPRPSAELLGLLARKNAREEEG
ncbi:helix-turn-helix domain-containing protein [Dermabacteraceae bacterium P7054]